MGDLYEADVLEWSEHQARLLHQHAAGKPGNEAPDWANIIEEVESVGRSQFHAVQSLLVLALLLYCLVLAGLIGLSTPNLGTLHRYRAVLLPWLLWLLLQHDGARRLLRRLKIGD